MSVDPDLWIISRTFRIQYGPGVGTAFYARVNGVNFFITAKHVVQGLSAGESIAIKCAGEWRPLLVKAVAFGAHESDVGVIQVEKDFGEAIREDQLDAGIILGEEVTYCGFPLGMENEALPDSPQWPTPVVKGGLMSGATFNGQYRLYLSDSLNNKGFSGGPIIIRDRQSKELRVVAVVSDYKFDRPLVVQRLQEDGSFADVPDFQVQPNSGFMRGVPINIAVDAAKTLT